MALVNFVGGGIWYPPVHPYAYMNAAMLSNDTALLDADEEEYQLIGRVAY